MATSFSIQDILSSRNNKRPSPSPPTPSNLPCATSVKANMQQQKAVVETEPKFSENKSLRKRSRDYASSESSSSASSSTLEVSPIPDSGSPAPTDLDTLSLIDGRRKSKRPRTAFTSAQLKGLEYYFRLCPYPDTMGRDVISRVTGIDDAKIQVWFQNRRARYRKREQPLKMSPVPPTPSRPHASNTLHTPRVSPATPKLSPPPTPQQAVQSPAPYVEMFCAMAYQLQRAYHSSPTGYVPFPYVLPRSTNSPSSTHNDTVQKEAAPTSS